MSKDTLNKINFIWKKMVNKEYRDSFSSSLINDRLCSQIHSLRTQKSLTQKELSKIVRMRQSRISALETDCEKVTLNTLRRIASAFDVALMVKFVPFSQLAKEASENIATTIASFKDDDINPPNKFNYVSNTDNFQWLQLNNIVEPPEALLHKSSNRKSTQTTSIFVQRNTESRKQYVH